jgi:N-acetylmuramoyl-L-alanine amidase
VKYHPRLFTHLSLLCLLWFIGQAHAFDTVIIDPGHGGRDPGAVRRGVHEKRLCLDVAHRLEDQLRERGFRTLMTRRVDKTVSLRQRVRLANAYPHAVFVSIHFNSTRRRSASGLETFYLGRRSRPIARSIQSRLDRRVTGRNRGINSENYMVLRATDGAAVLVECGFISNRAERERCLTPAHRQRVALAIAEGLQRVRRLRL